MYSNLSNQIVSDAAYNLAFNIEKIMKKTQKYQAGGVVGGNSKKKAPMVDPKGAFTKVQKRTLNGTKKK